MYFDSHAHLTAPQLVEEWKGILARAQEKGVDYIVNVCTDTESFHRGKEVRAFAKWVLTAAATPPHDVEKEGEAFFPLVEESARLGELIAIGETGLDYHYFPESKKTQQEFLIRYFHLAKERDLPVIIHCREAFTDLFALADREYGSERAVLHCFTGTLEEAKGVLDRGWYLSLSGIVTFKNAQELQEVARYVPLERLLVETDAPYLAPQSKRGRRNEPSFLEETVEFLAQLKKMTPLELAQKTKENAFAFFAL